MLIPVSRMVAWPLRIILPATTSLSEEYEAKPLAYPKTNDDRFRLSSDFKGSLPTSVAAHVIKIITRKASKTRLPAAKLLLNISSRLVRNMKPLFLTLQCLA